MFSSHGITPIFLRLEVPCLSRHMRMLGDEDVRSRQRYAMAIRGSGTCCGIFTLRQTGPKPIINFPRSALKKPEHGPRKDALRDERKQGNKVAANDPVTRLFMLARKSWAYACTHRQSHVTCGRGSTRERLRKRASHAISFRSVTAFEQAFPAPTKRTRRRRK